MSAVPVELATDNFNRADSADVGTSWAPVVNSLKIAGNQVRPASLSVSCWERYSAIAWGPDQYSQVVIRASASSEGAGPVVRMNTAAPETGYFAEAQGAVGGKLWRVVAGSYTQIATLPVINTGDTLRLEVTGSALTVKVNGIAVLTLSDAQIASGDVGIKAINTTDGNAQLDDWAGGKLVYPPQYPLYPDRLSQAKSEVVSDDFNRADSGNLGANWTIVTSQSAAQIVSNQVEPVSVSANSVEYYSAVTWNPDQYSEVTVTALPVSLGIGPAVRCSGSDCYYIQVRSGGNANIARLLGSIMLTVTGIFAVNDVVRLEVEGTVLRMFRNGILVDFVKDAVIATGSPGVFLATGGGAITNALLDNWKGGNLVRRPYYGESTRPKLLDPNHVVGLYY